MDRLIRAYALNSVRRILLHQLRTAEPQSSSDLIRRQIRPPDRPAERPARAESREVRELRELKNTQPDLASAADMQIELLGAQRRVQARVPLPSASLRTPQARPQALPPGPAVQGYPDRLERLPADDPADRRHPPPFRNARAGRLRPYPGAGPRRPDRGRRRELVSRRRWRRRRRKADARSPETRAARSGAAAGDAPVSGALRRGAACRGWS